MEIALIVVAAVLILVGLVGMVLPVLPGPILVAIGVAVWAVPRGDVLGWAILGGVVAILALGQVVKYLIPGQRMRESGVPGRTLLAGGVLGIVGFFVVPVIGIVLGFVLGVFLAELARLGDTATAWPSTRKALTAVGWSILIELASGMFAAAVWLGAVVFPFIFA